ncbi:MAG: GlyGly-CTERM sorting domain-containing protein, partial [Polyangiales bacterium]
GKTNTWIDAPPMLIGRATHTADPIEPGRVMVVGGPSAAAEEIWNALPGVDCTSDAQCGSGACVDGKCCDKACNGACEACDVPGKEGTCTPIDGSPRMGHATCAPYVTCSAGACAASCAKDGDCASGNVCFSALNRCGPSRGLCDAEGNVVSPAGQKTLCSPFVCGPSGECLNACATTLDCATGFVCDPSQKTCSAATPREAESSGGCATTFARAGSFGWLSLVGLALLLRRRRTAGFLAAIAIVTLSRSAAADAWRPTRPMSFPTRLYLPVTRLVDGRILVVGGSPNGDVSSAEIYDVAADTWSLAKPMSVPHTGHVAALLGDGRVLIVGGQDASKKPIDTVEIFDPAAGAFTLGPKIPTPRQLALSIKLVDGRVLVAGGVGAGDKGLTDVQIFDPNASAWSSGGTMSAAHASGDIALLSDGRVMVVGGVSPKKVDLYDPATNSWSAGPDTGSAHDSARAVALADGRVVVVGASSVAEIFDPKSNAWSQLASGLEVRYDHSATLLPTGEVLVVGGSDSKLDVLSQTSEILDPVGKSMRPGPRLGAPRATHGAAVLADGRTILVGGLSTIDDTVPISALPLIFQLQKGSPCGSDRDCDSSFCTDGVCCATRCKEACNACDLPGSVGTCKPLDGKPRKDHTTCAPFGACIAGGCASICGSDDYCDGEHVCDVASGSCIAPTSKCDGDDAVDNASGEHKACAPYKCARGKCGSRCATTDDCSGGAICDQGTCGSGAPPSDGGGCVYGARTGSGVFFVAALLVGAIRRRRRAKARPPCPTRI